ncbi:MAG: hypothetical protein KDA85_19335, partial [Planctomycetaceae bacterium]|nr:hypothetical protein [Planctomycetaceae bacterium]
MTNHPLSDSDDKSMRRLLQTLDADLTEPSDEQLARIRARWLTQRKDEAAKQSPRDSLGSENNPRRSGPSASRLIAMFTCVASLLFAVWLHAPASAESPPSLAEVLAQVEGTSVLAMTVSEQGHAHEMVFHAPGIVRWNDSETSYRVADGHRQWKVDTTNGAVTVESSPLPSEGTSAWRLLELELPEARVLSEIHPSGTATIEHQLCSLYHADVRFKGQPARLTAYADRNTGQPLRVVAVALADGEPGNQTAEVRVVSTAEESQLIRSLQPLRSLKDDGRLGILAENHGLVFIRAFPGHRWTRATAGMPLYAGDQIRCETRGANAAVIRLTQVSDTSVAEKVKTDTDSAPVVALSPELTLGPGGWLELQPASPPQLLSGDVYLRHLPSIIGPDGQTQTCPDEATLRAITEPAALQQLNVTPPWLQSLSGHLTAESLGSLVAQVDGRDVALTLGFHHVTIEIRNQIVRTVIEESFVNNTAARLEGQFHFPLPHDASISGFGMWVGGQLIEADVVERQRAREIYETILRENRDPGLLEWEGGNIFKARVFPIEAHSEKRIRITYTQTLPLQHGAMRYVYPLRSELLQQHPLRDLSIDVLVHSEVPLQTVRCLSHPITEIQQTEHSAQLHYEARETTPSRDFEFQCSLDGRQNDVVAIPHIRGDDGYLMVQLTPPAVSDGNWSRTLLRDGTPLEVILLCDTSRSIYQFARQQQAETVQSLLGSLGESDRIRLACCDVGCDWLQQEPAAVTEELRNRLQQQLQERRSLGWSNLQVAFEQAFAAAAAH